jgi:6-pyruvoyltetrahydropterin/6-carboxytetrahydropterin synthase
MPKVYVTRQVHFNAAHRIYNPEWTDQKNAEVFGLCSNPHGHGHNYLLEVTLCGEPDKDTGYVYDLKKLKDLLDEHILEKVDHKNLNVEVDFMSGINPTSENFVLAIWHELQKYLPKGLLYAIKLYETERNFVEYKGE